MKMHIVTGATGHVGSAVVKSLLAAGEEVLAITHSALNLPKLKLAGAQVERIDIHDVPKLASAFSRGETLFMLNPPADISHDAVEEEKRTVRCLLEALNLSTVDRVIAESTQGARPGNGIGDLGVLYEMEEGLRHSGRHVRVTRAAYYMSNWDMQADTVKKTGVLQTFFPADFKIAMVAPQDLGDFNAAQMLRSFTGFETVNVSGPEEYSSQDVADEFSRLFKRDVRVEVTPPSQWLETYQRQGFSAVAAKSYAEMTRLTMESVAIPADPFRGSTHLGEYLEIAKEAATVSSKIVEPLRL